MALLEVSDLFVNYGAIKAVQGISFQVEAGEIATIIGANGAGKSSTLNAIVRLVRTGNGKIVFNGKDITSTTTDSIVKMGISQTMEGRQIFPRMTVLENLMMGGYVLTKSVREMRAEEMLNLFPILRERIKQMAGTLSGGEQQMLSIARALMIHPQLLLMDEPSLGLAPKIVDLVFRKIIDINKELHASILLVEQNAKMALSISNRAYVMEKGKITLNGLAKELLESHKVMSAYLGS